jgi:hypothetical protein
MRRYALALERGASGARDAAASLPDVDPPVKCAAIFALGEDQLPVDV